MEELASQAAPGWPSPALKEGSGCKLGGPGLPVQSSLPWNPDVEHCHLRDTRSPAVGLQSQSGALTSERGPGSPLPTAGMTVGMAVPTCPFLGSSPGSILSWVFYPSRAVRAGPLSPFAVVCGVCGLLLPPFPSGASSAVSAKAGPLTLALVAVSTRNGGHSGVEGLCWGHQGKGVIVAGERPGLPWSPLLGSAPPVSSAGSLAG